MDVLSDETLSTEQEYELIIINDLNGTVEFTDNEIESLKNMYEKGKQICTIWERSNMIH